MKETILAALGTIGALIAHAFGGWTSALTTLCILMLADYITGFLVAAIFHKSPKTETGSLDSNIGWKGITKKCMVLLLVFVAHRMDQAIGTAYIKDGVCIAYIINEIVSLIENAGLMGVPVPEILLNAIEALKASKAKDPSAE